MRTSPTAATTVPSHLMYLPTQDRWIEATYVPDCGHDLGPGWEFKDVRDCVAWLPPREPLDEEGA